MSFVLIVEPDEVNAARIRTILESVDKSFEYELVESALDALDALEQRKPDVFIGDMQMPIMSGAELFSTVEMLSPETVRVVMTDGGKIEETVAFMNECRIFKIILKPCRMADDLMVPIQAAIRYKQTVERVAYETMEAGRGRDLIKQDYLELKEKWVELVSKHKRATHVLAELFASNLMLDAALPEKICDRLKRWYQWMTEEYVAQVLEGEGSYENTMRMMVSFCHDPAHGCSFRMGKKTKSEIEPERMKEITYVLRLVTGICKDLMNKWDIIAIIESTDRMHILRVRYRMEGTSFRVRNEALRAALIRATELGIEAIDCKTAVIPREQEIIFNLALPRNARFNAKL